MQDNRERLREHLRKKGLSFNRCGRLLEMDGVSIWRYVAGLRKPSMKAQNKMKKKLRFVWQS